MTIPKCLHHHSTVSSLNTIYLSSLQNFHHTLYIIHHSTEFPSQLQRPFHKTQYFIYHSIVFPSQFQNVTMNHNVLFTIIQNSNHFHYVMHIIYFSLFPKIPSTIPLTMPSPHPVYNLPFHSILLSGLHRRSTVSS